MKVEAAILQALALLAGLAPMSASAAEGRVAEVDGARAGFEEAALADGGLEDGGLADGDLEDGGVDDGGLDDGGVEGGGLEDGDLEDGALEDGSLGDGGAPNEAGWQAACAVSGGAYALRVDDQVYPTCEMVFGGAALRARHRAARRARILRVSSSGGRIDVLHQDPTLHAPRVRGLEGLEVLAVLDAEVEELSCEAGEPAGAEEEEGEPAREGAGHEAAREPVALVQLSGPFSTFCPADLYAVRVDDAIGADGHVVDLDPRGLLALYRGELLWVPRSNDSRTPQFRLTWRSDFVLLVEDKKAKSTPKRRPKRRRRRGRR